MTDEEEVAGWTNGKRQDGAIVKQDLHSWVVLRPGKRPLLSCPCCDLPFASARAAKLVCNAIQPLRPGRGGLFGRMPE